MRNVININCLCAAIAAGLLLSLASCRAGGMASRTVEASPVALASGVRHAQMMGGVSQALPKAVIYRTNGDYADLVPVTLNADRDGLLSYPAPSDITADSAPLRVSDGWLLDRRGGVGENTAFLKYTFTQYRDLSQVSASMLMRAVVPGARVTDVRVLPFTVEEALSNPNIVDQYINNSITK